MDFHRRTQNVALTCRHFGISRPTFYRWLQRYEPLDLDNAGRAQSLSSSTAPAHLVLSSSKKGFAVAVAVSPLGQRQAGGASTGPEVYGLDLHGRPHYQPAETLAISNTSTVRGHSFTPVTLTCD
jgi:hypothetical protein